VRGGLEVAGGGAPVRPGAAARGWGRETGSGEETGKTFYMLIRCFDNVIGYINAEYNIRHLTIPIERE
jgi:hypothetical protein